MTIEKVLLQVMKSTKSEIDRLSSPHFISKCKSKFERRRVKLNEYALPDGGGIYLFWVMLPEGVIVKEDLIEYIQNIWDRKRNVKENYPKFNKKRAKKSLQNVTKEQWIPLYLGDPTPKLNHLHREPLGVLV